MSLEGTQCERFENNCFSRGENCKPFRFSCNLSVSLNFNAYTFGHCVIFSDKKITTHPSPNVMATTLPLPKCDGQKKNCDGHPPPPPPPKGQMCLYVYAGLHKTALGRQAIHQIPLSNRSSTGFRRSLLKRVYYITSSSMHCNCVHLFPFFSCCCYS